MSAVIGEIILIGVQRDQIDEYFAKCKHFLKKAAKIHGEYDLDTILRELKARRSQLWCLCQNKEVIACAMTNVQIRPCKKVLFIHLCAGKNSLKYSDYFMSSLEKWAKELNCTQIQTIGRKGLKRVFPEFTETGILLTKNIN